MKLILLSTKNEIENVISFIFKPETPLTWVAGQYLRYHIEDSNPDTRRENRFFTIASAPFEQNVMLTTKFVPGDGSTFKKDLQNLKIGDSIEVSGPNGEFTAEDVQKKYVFIAGGIGITPFRSIMVDLDHKRIPADITLLYANRTENAVFRNELNLLSQNNPTFKIKYFIGDNRIDQNTITQLNYDLKETIFYISGPEPMVESFEIMLTGMGVPAEQTRRDYFVGYEGI